MTIKEKVDVLRSDIIDEIYSLLPNDLFMCDIYVRYKGKDRVIKFIFKEDGIVKIVFKYGYRPLPISVLSIDNLLTVYDYVVKECVKTA